MHADGPAAKTVSLAVLAERKGSVLFSSTCLSFHDASMFHCCKEHKRELSADVELNLLLSMLGPGLNNKLWDQGWM